ncbi:ABC transporter permease [Aestuariimicrobium sp. T2.26MG-19.2B]|uniref:ABC transporter permease n=1 Tax=Aestuariimicrobium sp. T2.26MG-19.2B TaxID=3040679 RepID=UPI002477B819|nr:ABC-2 family transporter protein [Aestuariimicrobium sp. T2.26MG-19.2B]CAI9411706.1 hypothetical protein AESSP_02704 [Aestuariimicrobium sp. T2.26MG-19.2B]
MSTLIAPAPAALDPRPGPAIGAYIRNAIRSVWMYRLDLLISFASQIITVWLLKVVWTTVYGGASSVNGISRTQSVNYAVLAGCLQTALMPWNFSSLADRVRGGQIGIDITRPLGLIGQCLAQNTGTLIARLPITMVGLVAAALIGAFTLPPHGATVIWFALSLVLGVVLVMLMNLLMSFITFWSLEVGGYMMLYRLGTALASGALIPLWFMPGWLAGALKWLPFQAQMFSPLSIYFGQVEGAGIVRALSVQLFWVLLMIALSWLVWKRAMHKVVVLGG